MIKAKELRILLGGIAPSTLDKWLDALEFPPPIFIGRYRHWMLDEVRQWIKKLPRQRPARNDR